MRLYEIATDLDSIVPILHVLRGLAAKTDSNGSIPFPVLMNHLQKFDLPIGGLESDRQRIVQAIKDTLGPAGKIISKINADGSIVVDVPKDPSQKIALKTPGPDIDAMASQGARAEPTSLNAMASKGAKSL